MQFWARQKQTLLDPTKALHQRETGGGSNYSKHLAGVKAEARPRGDRPAGPQEHTAPTGVPSHQRCSEEETETTKLHRTEGWTYHDTSKTCVTETREKDPRCGLKHSQRGPAPLCAHHPAAHCRPSLVAGPHQGKLAPEAPSRRDKPE